MGGADFVPFSSNRFGRFPSFLKMTKIGLCLSGGGYRATIFHIGVIWRLKELGLLQRLTHISSVSGGSITSGFLGLNWKAILEAKTVDEAFKDLISMVSTEGLGIDGKDLLFAGVHSAIKKIGSVFDPNDKEFNGIADGVKKDLNKTIFKNKHLKDLPNAPQFFFNSTNLKTGNSFVFGKYQMGECDLGYIKNDKGLNVEVADAVTASAGFPPIVSPVFIPLSGQEKWEVTQQEAFQHKDLFMTKDILQSGCGIRGDEKEIALLQKGNLILADGGVIDNLGLDPILHCDYIIVSDAGGQIGPETVPDSEKIKHFLRVFDIVDNQVRTLRKAQLIHTFEKHNRKGVYFSIHGTLNDDSNSTEKLNPPAFASNFPPDKIKALSHVKTTLYPFNKKLINYLINWGYCRCDSAVRAYLLNSENCETVVGVKKEALSHPVPPRADPDLSVIDIKQFAKDLEVMGV